MAKCKLCGAGIARRFFRAVPPAKGAAGLLRAIKNGWWVFTCKGGHSVDEDGHQKKFRK
jgi:hypothetical protein